MILTAGLLRNGAGDFEEQVPGWGRGAGSFF
jgi:hypothetical protein